jgi:hypothetical protein
MSQTSKNEIGNYEFTIEYMVYAWSNVVYSDDIIRPI